MSRVPFYLCFLVAIFCGCTRVHEPDGNELSKLVEPRIGRRVQWSQGTKEDLLVDEIVTLLLQNELTVDAAVHLSLLCNRSLQAMYQEIGISQADIVQAGLLPNPFVSAQVGFPTQSGASISTQFSIAQNFIDAFSISLRKKYASLQQELIELKIAHAILDHVAKVESAYFELQAEMGRCTLLKTVVEIEEAQVQLSQRQLQAGNVYEIGVAKHEIRLHEAKIEFVKSESEILILRERMNELLGLWGKNALWKIPGDLSDIPSQELDVSDLENLAIKNRLDLKSAKKEVELLAQALGLKKWWTYTEGQIGVLQNRDSEGISSIGPTFGAQIPIFDYGQAERAKLSAKLKQSYERMSSLIVSIRAEVRASQEKLLASRALAEYLLKTVTPLQNKTMQLAQKLYNSMSISPYKLLKTRRDVVEAELAHLLAVKKYWQARVELGKQVGGKLLLRCL